MTDFTFDKPNHVYRLDGDFIPSLTNLLSPIYMPGLSHVPDQDVVEAARKRGTIAHDEIDRMNKGLCDKYESDYTLMWSEFCNAVGLRVTHSEYSTYHPSAKYGTTIDVLGTLGGTRAVLIDIKTGSKHKWHPLQTAGQAGALSLHGLCDRTVLRGNLRLIEKSGVWSYWWDEHGDPSDFNALHDFIGWERAKERYT